MTAAPHDTGHDHGREPFDTEAYWRARDRGAEWDRWTCADCGATCVGDPAEHWCGEVQVQ